MFNVDVIRERSDLGGAGGTISLSSQWTQAAVMSENKKMTLLLGMINGARVTFAIRTTWSVFCQD